ncbi:MAG: hypothetical protein A3H97_08875 [Acidobacteria bacterium RIFCSPLOWO2_02_FULL_65_29]|nr:MAG: hypothetical protein A3H97_08875 [Acidobacteria bacterium RIFCSPLOWO2_02_FULL_65_29]
MLDAATRRARLQEGFRWFPGSIGGEVQRQAAAAARAADGLWRRNPAVWSADSAVQRTIANRLGWLGAPRLMAESIDRLLGAADAALRDGFTDMVLLGMGGSSLAPEVLRAVVGVAPGRPRFHMLDSTDPAAVAAVAPPLARTLFILASKSGTTIEPNSLAAHFERGLQRAGVARWADHFIAITDEGTALAERARAEGFRETFINPSDIGGRYSALSYFGLVPAALMGQNVRALVDWALAMLSASQSNVDPMSNPSVALGLAMAAGARAGRDKLTLVAPRELEPFGLWAEQLVAESTGKEGVGVAPIVGEAPDRPERYGDDRVFVRLALEGGTDPRLDVAGVKAANRPIVEIDVAEPLALGAEFVRWEIATAVAGALLRINPFDEPNVQQAKDATRVLLEEYKTKGSLPIPPPDRTLGEGVTLRLTSAARRDLHGRGPEALLTLLTERDYFSLLAYLGPDKELAEALHGLRMHVRDRTHAATMSGYGPRYLHSTGQLHKGGPNTGVFVLITASPHADLPIPGEAFSFGTLEMAQALGDFASLDATGRRAVQVHLPAPDPQLLRLVGDSLLAGIERSSR